MRIQEILSEAPSSFQQGKAAMNKVMSPTKWLDGTEFKAGYDKGRNVMNKVLTPSRWFEKGADSSPKKIQPQVIRQALINAAQGKPLYQSDVAALKSAQESAPDAATIQAVKMAYTGKPLSKEQQQLLLTLSKKF